MPAAAPRGLRSAAARPARAALLPAVPLLLSAPVAAPATLGAIAIPGT